MSDSMTRTIIDGGEVIVFLDQDTVFPYTISEPATQISIKNNDSSGVLNVVVSPENEANKIINVLPDEYPEFKFNRFTIIDTVDTTSTSFNIAIMR